MGSPGAGVRADTYNYEHFSLGNRTLSHLGGVQTGETAPDFTAVRLDGKQVRLSDYRGRAIVLECGSATCPMYESGITAMNALAARYPEVAFLVLYTREAHPGERLGPHCSVEHKIQTARLVTEADGERREVLVDDLDGTAHQLYGAMPNTVHVIDQNGAVVLRGMWNDPDVVDQALRALWSGTDIEQLRAGFRPAPPTMLIGILRRAGWRALWDFVKAVPRLVIAHSRPSRDGSR